ncbi:SHOCT domain-containing protein [Streptomyces sp. A73]|uniref:SHOCT domain-containing protein n=1 Tax=unclassified Streptomyces TaxID=2593676 RepID=UPI000C19C2B7|nr:MULTISPECIES: SHOCT domain-containing protein [unclassified Streptomyces]MBQ0866033.1 SHOCT domain-containing protein [Streptomyces sp. RK75]MBQ1121943.1 SHOCT domain-containing protein [Streptomyces sp. B15]MBQ1162273.1 SHOCT domain-containing protein [Streptomyces sp. A73]
MQTLAQWHNDGGPGPWILFFPLIWAAVIAGGVFLLRTVRRGHRGPRAAWGAQPHMAQDGTGSPLDLLDRRFAQGEIDEDEYWRRASVLHESTRERHGGPTGGKR